jgi:hypothetical protein
MVAKLFLFLNLVTLSACADLTSSGKKVSYIETDDLLSATQIAEKLTAKNECEFIGYVDAKTSYFPGSYSSHENEVHAALKNRAAKMGANLVIANFYQKPAQGVGLLCPAEFITQKN